MSKDTDIRINPMVRDEATAPLEPLPGIPEHVPTDYHTPTVDTPQDISRRKFLSKISLALSAAGGVVVAVPVVGFIIGPLIHTQNQNDVNLLWQSVYTNDHRGETNPQEFKLDQMKVGDTLQVNFKDPSSLAWAGVVANSAAWLRRESETQLIAYSVNCTHLGCPVSWLPDAGLFMCPCHGGVYYQNGDVAAGPPPNALPRYETRVVDGKIQLKAIGIQLTQ